jgi:soluble lytic murein transglycosylase-like protein
VLAQPTQNLHPQRKINTHTTHGISGEATKLVALRFLPVALAFILSFVSILWLTAFRPASRQQDALKEEFEKQVSIDMDPSSKLVSMGNASLSQVFTKEVQFWASAIQLWSVEFSLDPNLIALVMQIESCGHPEIQSPAGARGLFQVMPFHFRDGENALDPSVNALRGLSYLTRSLEISGGNHALALAGYNGGHSVIQWKPEQWSDETSRYVYWGTGILEDISAGLSQSPRLLEWLSNGGESMCNQAAGALDL